MCNKYDSCQYLYLKIHFRSPEYFYLLASLVVRRPLTSSSQVRLDRSLKNLPYSIFRVRIQEILKFISPWDQYFGVNRCKPNVFFFKSSLDLLLGIGQTKWVLYKYWLHERVTLEIVTPSKPMSNEARQSIIIIWYWMFNKYIVYITFGFQTIQVRLKFEFVFRTP